MFPGERRIRVHTLALPITNKLADLYATADVQAIATLLTKMGKMDNNNYTFILHELHEYMIVCALHTKIKLPKISIIAKF